MKWNVFHFLQTTAPVDPQGYHHRPWPRLPLGTTLKVAAAEAHPRTAAATWAAPAGEDGAPQEGAEVRAEGVEVVDMVVEVNIIGVRDNYLVREGEIWKHNHIPVIAVLLGPVLNFSSAFEE